MRRLAFLIIAALAVAVIQSGFVTALPAPASYVDLPLILVVALITSFKFGDAYIAALVAGIAADALSSLPFGMRTVALVATCAVTVFLFTRIFTHHSWQGNIALHIGAYWLSGATLVIARLLRATFVGFPLFPAVAEPRWQTALMATFCQLLTVLLVTSTISAVSAALSRVFFFRPNAR